MIASELIKDLQTLIHDHGDLEVKGKFAIPHATREGACTVVLGQTVNYACKPPLHTRHFNVGLSGFNDPIKLKEKPDGTGT